MTICSLCEKKTRIGRNRSHAQNRTPRTFKPNIQKVTMMVEGEKLSGKFCTKCLKRIRKDMAAA